MHRLWGVAIPFLLLGLTTATAAGAESLQGLELAPMGAWPDASGEGGFGFNPLLLEQSGATLTFLVAHRENGAQKDFIDAVRLSADGKIDLVWRAKANITNLKPVLCRFHSTALELIYPDYGSELVGAPYLDVRSLADGRLLDRLPMNRTTTSGPVCVQGAGHAPSTDAIVYSNGDRLAIARHRPDSTQVPLPVPIAASRDIGTVLPGRPVVTPLWDAERGEIVADQDADIVFVKPNGDVRTRVSVRDGAVEATGIKGPFQASKQFLAVGTFVASQNSVTSGLLVIDWSGAVVYRDSPSSSAPAIFELEGRPGIVYTRTGGQMLVVRDLGRAAATEVSMLRPLEGEERDFMRELVDHPPVVIQLAGQGPVAYVAFRDCSLFALDIGSLRMQHVLHRPPEENPKPFHMASPVTVLDWQGSPVAAVECTVGRPEESFIGNFFYHPGGNLRLVTARREGDTVTGCVETERPERFAKSQSAKVELRASGGSPVIDAVEVGLTEGRSCVTLHGKDLTRSAYLAVNPTGEVPESNYFDNVLRVQGSERTPGMSPVLALILAFAIVAPIRNRWATSPGTQGKGPSLPQKRHAMS